MSDREIEQEIQAKGLTAPRVTPADIEAHCNSLMRFRLALSAHAAYHRKKFATKTIGDYLQVRRVS